MFNIECVMAAPELLLTTPFIRKDLIQENKFRVNVQQLFAGSWW
jgi:hypothetical protein